MGICAADTHLFEQTLELILLRSTYEEVLIVNLFDYELIAMLGVDLDQYGFNRWIALDQNAYILCVRPFVP